MKSRNKELEARVVELISTRMHGFGFVRRGQSQSFDKLTSFGKWSFHLAVVEHKNDFDITADVAIRFDDVEELINQNSLLSNKEKKNTFSMGAELGNFKQGAPQRWTVSAESDVEKVARAIVDFFQTNGLPYLEKYSDRNTALEVLSGDGPDSWKHNPLHSARATRSIALAVLMGKREIIPAMLAKKAAFLKSKNDFALPSFLRFKAEIENQIE